MFYNAWSSLENSSRNIRGISPGEIFLNDQTEDRCKMQKDCAPRVNNPFINY